jgi:hypothetical protein
LFGFFVLVFVLCSFSLCGLAEIALKMVPNRAPHLPAALPAMDVCCHSLSSHLHCYCLEPIPAPANTAAKHTAVASAASATRSFFDELCNNNVCVPGQKKPRKARLKAHLSETQWRVLLHAFN